jgi:hypothetical protein
VKKKKILIFFHLSLDLLDGVYFQGFPTNIVDEFLTSGYYRDVRHSYGDINMNFSARVLTICKSNVYISFYTFVGPEQPLFSKN